MISVLILRIINYLLNQNKIAKWAVDSCWVRDDFCLDSGETERRVVVRCKTASQSVKIESVVQIFGRNCVKFAKRHVSFRPYLLRDCQRSGTRKSAFFAQDRDAEVGEKLRANLTHYQFVMCRKNETPAAICNEQRRPWIGNKIDEGISTAGGGTPPTTATATATTTAALRGSAPAPGNATPRRNREQR